ncbi:MAG: hypothetical protein EHM21_04310 [Chloroflexi bacterium]|nr:MAG: hypothetical protein EHM21_04310 [Chloroflexota bacterium]
MSLPGFTADVSLYRTEGQYHAALVPRSARGLVTPAFVDTHCHALCYDTCYSNAVTYWGWSEADAQSICPSSCNNECECSPVTYCTTVGLCTTCEVCCGSDCSTATTNCVPTPKGPEPRWSNGNFLIR